MVVQLSAVALLLTVVVEAAAQGELVKMEVTLKAATGA
jgi:hypothetical protein